MAWQGIGERPGKRQGARGSRERLVAWLGGRRAELWGAAEAGGKQGILINTAKEGRIANRSNGPLHYLCLSLLSNFQL